MTGALTSVHDLIQRVKSGDDSAIEPLCHCLQPMIHREAARVSARDIESVERELCEELIIGIKYSE